MSDTDGLPAVPAAEIPVGASPPGGMPRREFLRRAGLLGLGTAAASGLLETTAPGRAAGQTTPKREPVFAQAGDIPNFDPHLSTATIDRIETPDAHTVLIHAKKPDPLLPGRLAAYGGQIVPKKYVETVGPDTFNARPVGTGPVRFVSWTKDDRTVLEANPDYWGGKSDVDRLVMRAIPETAPRVASLLTGGVDAGTQLAPDHGGRVNANPTTRMIGALNQGPHRLP